MQGLLKLCLTALKSIRQYLYSLTHFSYLYYYLHYIIGKDKFLNLKLKIPIYNYKYGSLIHFALVKTPLKERCHKVELISL